MAKTDAGMAATKVARAREVEARVVAARAVKWVVVAKAGAVKEGVARAGRVAEARVVATTALGAATERRGARAMRPRAGTAHGGEDAP